MELLRDPHKRYVVIASLSNRLTKLNKLLSLARKSETKAILKDIEQTNNAKQGLENERI